MQSMFIETESGRLQNLYLLQDVRAMEIEDSDKFTVAYVQSNGMIVQEGEYDSFEDADSKAQEIKASLVGEGE